MAAVFPDSRLRRAGAKHDDVKAFGAHWSALSEDDRQALADQVAGMHNRDVLALAQDLAAAPGTIYQAPGADTDQGGDGGADFADALATVDSAKAHADAHPDQVESLLAAEKAGKDRTTLVAHLEALIADAWDGDDDPDNDGGE